MSMAPLRVPSQMSLTMPFVKTLRRPSRKLPDLQVQSLFPGIGVGDFRGLAHVCLLRCMRAATVGVHSALLQFKRRTWPAHILTQPHGEQAASKCTLLSLSFCRNSTSYWRPATCWAHICCPGCRYALVSHLFLPCFSQHPCFPLPCLKKKKYLKLSQLWGCWGNAPGEVSGLLPWPGS